MKRIGTCRHLSAPVGTCRHVTNRPTTEPVLRGKKVQSKPSTGTFTHFNSSSPWRDISGLSLWSIHPNHGRYGHTITATPCLCIKLRILHDWFARIAAEASERDPSSGHHVITYVRCTSQHSLYDHDMAAATPFQPSITIRLLLYSIRRPHQYTILPSDIHQHMILEDTLVWHCTYNNYATIK